MWEAINNALNFVVVGPSSTSILEEGIGSGNIGIIDLYISGPEPTASLINNSMNFVLGAPDIGESNNSLNMLIESRESLGIGFELGMYGYAENSLDSSILFSLKGNYFDVMSNAINFFIARNENAFLDFVICGPGLPSDNNLDFVIMSKEISTDSLNLYTNGIGVTSITTPFYTHGF